MIFRNVFHSWKFCSFHLNLKFSVIFKPYSEIWDAQLFLSVVHACHPQEMRVFWVEKETSISSFFLRFNIDHKNKTRIPEMSAVNETHGKQKTYGKLPKVIKER